MTITGSKKFIIAFCFLLLFYFTCFSVAFAQQLKAPPAKTNHHPKISSYLQHLEKEYKNGVSEDKLVAQGMITNAVAPNSVPVYLMSAPGTRIDETALSNIGAEITKRSGNIIRAQVPINMLTAVADTVSGISFMKAPDTFIPAAVESQGVSLTGADSYHTAGYDGTGVNIAVFDVGFAGESSAILGSNVVKVDCTGFGCVSSNFSSETDSHGTAVAEIVHDMAPGAKLYLIKVDDRLDLSAAKNYAIDNGINIINLSGGYLNQNFYGGNCYSNNAACTANDAQAHNILWVNAAGNEAQRHYEAFFSDPDGNGFHNISGSGETIKIDASTGSTIDVYLTWDAWPTTDQDYDLYLFDKSLNPLNPDPSSKTTQTGTQSPTEHIYYPVPTGGTYYLAIYKNSPASDHLFELYSVNHDLTPAVAASSLLSPADAAGAMAVGAIQSSQWTTGPQDFFSSQGPTTDGRIKPDIMGPDEVSNSIIHIFSGTSASSPHVAGAAALILDQNPGLLVNQLRNSLTSTAIDMGDPGQDNIYGYGRLNLDINAVISSSTGADGGGGGGGCFIDAAAYGSYEGPYIGLSNTKH